MPSLTLRTTLSAIPLVSERVEVKVCRKSTRVRHKDPPRFDWRRHKPLKAPEGVGNICFPCWVTFKPMWENILHNRSIPMLCSWLISSSICCDASGARSFGPLHIAQFGAYPDAQSLPFVWWALKKGCNHSRKEPPSASRGTSSQTRAPLCVITATIGTNTSEHHSIVTPSLLNCGCPQERAAHFRA